MKKSILIVDDEKIITNVLKRLLSNPNFKIDVANNGLSAMDLIIKNKYDLMILDILMPKVNGVQLLWQLAKMRYETKKIIISACNEKQISTDLTPFSIDAYFKKPFDNIDNIAAAVKEVLQD